MIRILDRPTKLAASALALIAALAVLATGCAETTKPVAGPPAVLAITVQPSQATAGAPLTPALTVEVRDAQGRTVDTSQAHITVTIASGTAGAHLRGVKELDARRGVATFPDLSVDSTGSGYVLAVSAPGLFTAMSEQLSIVGGPAAGLRFVRQPASVTAGAPFTPPVTVVVIDSLGNQHPSASIAVTVAIAQGSGTAGAHLRGPATQTTRQGLAAFSALSVDSAGVAYALTASAAGLKSTGSDTFDVAVGPPLLTFLVQPSGTTTGATLDPPVQVGVRDSMGNRVPGTATAISVAIRAGSGAPLARLRGSTTQTTSRGDASYPDLSIDRASAGFILEASAPGLQPGFSSLFTVRLAARTLSVAFDHTCIVAVGGVGYCWGENADGQLGDSTYTAANVPTPVAGGRTFTSISTGFHHTCGITTGGAAYCWGANADGELGDGSLTPSPTPVAVADSISFAAVDAGDDNTCGLDGQGAAYCWGSNRGGALGNGTFTSSATPVAVVAGLAFTSIRAGLSSCGITRTAAAYCWGSDGVDGGQTVWPVPVPVPGGFSYGDIDGSGIPSCGVTMDGAARCWGNALHYVQGTNDSSSVPVVVSGGLTVAKVSVGNFQACLVTTAGAASCWGVGWWGQLGNGSLTSSATPVDVYGGLTFASISSGDLHVCGLTTARVVYCWGYNAFGQLGNGNNGQQYVPARVALF
jgi:hypothetical protein